MKRILVPTDLGPLTDWSLPVAVSLARQHGAEVVLLHYVPSSLAEPALTDAPISIAAYLNEQAAEAEATLRALARHSDYTDVSIATVVARGPGGLFGSLAGQPADLVVVASQGSSGWQEWLIGSNAEQIVKHVHAPVLVVKQPYATFAPQKPLCAIDVDERLKGQPAWPFRLGDGVRAFVYVMTPSDPRVAEGIRDWMTELADALHLTDYQLTIAHDSDVPAGIIHEAERQGADLILLFTHQKTGLAHLISGSVAEDVVNHATQPVLVMPLPHAV